MDTVQATIKKRTLGFWIHHMLESYQDVILTYYCFILVLNDSLVYILLTKRSL